MNIVEENLKKGVTKDKSTFIADTAKVLGNVTLGDNVGVWYNVTIRGDINSITIGDNSNIQDGSIIHVGYKEPVIVGKNVTVGHNVILHGCKVHDNCLIGMGAILLNGSIVEENTIVAAGSIVPQGKVVKSGTLFMGAPAKYVRDLTEDDLKYIQRNAEEYVNLIEIYNKLGIK